MDKIEAHQLPPTVKRVQSEPTVPTVTSVPNVHVPPPKLHTVRPAPIPSSSSHSISNTIPTKPPKLLNGNIGNKVDGSMGQMGPMSQLSKSQSSTVNAVHAAPHSLSSVP